MNIGDWIRRKGTGRGPKWHLVESIVAGDAVTRCGRRLDRVTERGFELQVSEVMPLTRAIGQPQLCKAGCETVVYMVLSPQEVFEDDASTQPEMVP